MEQRIGALGVSPMMALQRLNAYVETEMRQPFLVS